MPSMQGQHRSGWRLVALFFVLVAALVIGAVAWDAAALVMGVVSGVLAAGSLLVLNRISEVVLLPWFHERVHRGQDYSGEWILSAQGAQAGTVRLTQIGTRLQGECVLVLKQSATVETRSVVEEARAFRMDGEVFEGVMRLNYEHTRRDRFGFGSMLLQAQGDRRILDGTMVYYAVTKSRIVAHPCTLVRTGVDPEVMQPRLNLLDAAAEDQN